MGKVDTRRTFCILRCVMDFNCTAVKVSLSDCNLWRGFFQEAYRRSTIVYGRSWKDGCMKYLTVWIWDGDARHRRLGIVAGRDGGGDPRAYARNRQYPIAQKGL